MEAEKLYQSLYTIRHFETRLLELFGEGKLNGTTHAYIGQEANAVGVITHLQSDDVVWSNHRCHGHYLTYTNDLEGLVHELVGTSKGTCAGKGGSQHLCKGNFFTNGIQGSITAVAAGMALSQKLSNSKAISTVFIGDGTLGEGLVYEVMNIASLWKLPILFVLEHNQYAQSTPATLEVSGIPKLRPESFGIKTFEIDSNDINETYLFGEEITNFVRTNRLPAFAIMHTYRLCPHSKGDDFRDVSEIEHWKTKDPIGFAQKLLAKEAINQIEESVHKRMHSAVQDALSLFEQQKLAQKEAMT
jgi:TPP-dependent pyruvate/acetoin dehydrogenase alpha subunit